MTSRGADSVSRPGPIFIVGMNGSGTTVLLDLINSHSQIYGFPEETRILPYFVENVAKYGDLDSLSNRKRLWQDMCRSFPFWSANEEQPVKLPSNWQELSSRPADIFDYIMTEFARRHDKRIWCEKTPMYANHVSMLAREFPTARIVHIIRDGRDCAASFASRWKYDPLVTMFRWKQTIRKARAQAGALESNRYKEVRFEELTMRPEFVLKKICQFVGVEFEDSIMTSERPTERVRGKASRSLVPNSGRYRVVFTTKEIARLERVGGALLYELGYEPNNPKGDETLSRLYISRKQIASQFRRLRDIIDRAKHSQSPVRLFVSRIRSGLQYKRTSH